MAQVSSDQTDLEIKSILLLDDDIKLADTLKELLETRNYVVTTVRNGVEGLHEVMALDFDVVMCDMMMPNMAGDMFYKAVERTKPHLCKRFVFITGHSDNQKVMDFLKSVNGVVLFKPVESEELIRAVSMAIQRSKD